MGRSHSSSRSRSRSSSGRRSRSHSRRRHNDRRRSRSNSGDMLGTRVHVSDIPVSISKVDLEKTFEKFGPLIEVWKTNSVPCFAFVVFRNKDDAEDAIRSLNGQHIFGSRVRVTLALPRARERQRRSGVFNSDARCYQCGMPGHFSRSCRYYEGAGRNRMVPSPPPRRRYSPQQPARRRRRSMSSSRSRSGSRGRQQQSARDRRSSGDRRRSSDRRRDRRESHKEEEGRRSFKERSRSRSPEVTRSRSRSQEAGDFYEDDVINAQD